MKFRWLWIAALLAPAPSLAGAAPAFGLTRNGTPVLLGMPDGGGSGAAAAGALSLAIDDMPLRSVLQGLAEQAGASLVIGPEVEGSVSANLADVTFEGALRAMLGTTPYGYTRRDGVWSVGAFAVETRVVNLTYVDGEAVKEAIAPFLSDKGKVEALSMLANADVAGNRAKATLVVTDLPDRLDRIEAVIRALDVRPRQVRIEARMVETNLGHETLVGVRWNLDVSASGAAAPTTFPFRHDAAPLPDYAVQGDADASGTGTEGGRQFLPGEFFPTAQRDDFVFGIMDAHSLGVTMQALDSDNRSHLLSSPTITTTDGRKAQVMVGQQIPIPIYERQEQTGVLEIIGYEQQPIGIQLDVTPHVGRDGEILMEVTPSTSDIVEFIGQYKDRPITSTRLARTQVVVEQGQTLAIAGLIADAEYETRSKVPLLGVVPLLGRLFRHEGKEKRKTELLIFITPTVLD